MGYSTQYIEWMRGANSSIHYYHQTRGWSELAIQKKRKGGGGGALRPLSPLGPGRSQPIDAQPTPVPEAPPTSIGRMMLSLLLCMRERVLLTTSTKSSQLSIGGGYGRRGISGKGRDYRNPRGLSTKIMCVAYGARGVEISHSGAAGRREAY